MPPSFPLVKAGDVPEWITLASDLVLRLEQYVGATESEHRRQQIIGISISANSHGLGQEPPIETA